MQITCLKENHIKEIILLSDKIFGLNFLTTKCLYQYINSHVHFGFVCTIDKNIIGYILADNINYNLLKSSFLKDNEWFETALIGLNNICLIKQIAVAEESRKQGVANLLIQKIGGLAETHCCLAWKRGQSTPLKNVLLRNNFKFQKTIQEYWKNDSQMRKYNCSTCGKPPCLCRAEVYFKKKASTIS